MGFLRIVLISFIFLIHTNGVAKSGPLEDSAYSAFEFTCLGFLRDFTSTSPGLDGMGLNCQSISSSFLAPQKDVRGLLKQAKPRWCCSYRNEHPSSPAADIKGRYGQPLLFFAKHDTYPAHPKVHNPNIYSIEFPDSKTVYGLRSGSDNKIKTTSVNGISPVRFHRFMLKQVAVHQAMFSFLRIFAPPAGHCDQKPRDKAQVNCPRR